MINIFNKVNILSKTIYFQA